MAGSVFVVLVGLVAVGLLVGLVDVAAVRWLGRSDPGWRRRVLRVGFWTFALWAVSSAGSGEEAQPLMADVSTVGALATGVAIVVVHGRRGRPNGPAVAAPDAPAEGRAVGSGFGAGMVAAVALSAVVTGLLVGSEVGRARVDVAGIRAEGHAAGLAEGEDVGRTEGIAEGREEGFAEGEEVGFEQGRAEGYEEGVKVGDEQGYQRGYDDGLQRGRASATDRFDEGYQAGYTDGSGGLPYCFRC